MISWNPDKQFDELKKSLVSRVKEILSVEGKNYSVEVDDVWVDDKLDPQDLRSQKEARNLNKTWAVPVLAALKIKDSTGKVVAKTKGMKVIDLPKMTTRQGFIVDGTEYQIANQFRLKPGVYTRELQTGEIASQVNLAKGMNFKVVLDPKSGVYKAQFGGIGGTKVNLYSLLKILDTKEPLIQRTFGDLYKANLVPEIGGDIKKVYKTIFYEEADNENQAVNRLREYFNATKINPETTRITLGKPHLKVSGDLMLDTARKLLRVNKGEEEPDNRESLQFKRLHTLEDILDDRMRVFKPKLQSNIRRRLATDREIKDVRSIVQPDKVNKVVKSLFNTSDLSMTPEQINPVHILNTFNKTTVLGEGGIGSRHAVVMEQRDIDPSHMGFLDPIHSPEGRDIGTTLHLTTGVDKRGGELVTQVYNPKTKKLEYIDPTKLFQSKVAFPGQFDTNYKPTKGRVDIMHRGEMQTSAPRSVDYIIPSAVNLFSVSTNLVPFLNSDQGARAEMAAKMIEQALPLTEAEQPYVQSKVRRDSPMTFEGLVGRTTAVHTPTAGEITKIDEDEITVKDSSGKTHKVQIYNNFALNSNTFLHSSPLVKVGDKVRKGQVIADSNYTRNGVLAMGKNLKVAYLPYKGYNLEDGIVISESAAQKTTSPHLEKYESTIVDTDVLDKKKFDVYYPQTLTKDQLDKLGDDGVIREGSRIEPGDVLFAYLRKQELTEEDELLGKISKTLKKPYKRVLVTYDKQDPGEVVEVVRTAKGLSVRVRVNKVTKIGDKFAGRHGNKGVVTLIVPDNEMPRTTDGEPIDMLLNPHGLPSRINTGQLLETAAGKIAEKTGKPYVVTNFEEDNQLEKLQKELKANGLSDTEEVIDPITGKSLGQVMVGRQFIMKQNHPTEKKFAARSTGTYTADLTPGRGGGEGGQSVDHLTTFSLLAHGAKHNLRDIAAIKAEKNDEYWRALQLKEPLPAPRPSFAFEKQVALMKQLGVNVDKSGSKLQLVPLTDGDIMQMSKGEISSGKLLLSKNLRPEKNGLFDPLKTGGLRGDKWSHIRLAEELPHPMFEDAIKSVGDISTDQYTKFISGKLHVDKNGEINDEGRGVTGGKALKQILSKVNLQELYDTTLEKAPNLKSTSLNKANQKLRFLKNLLDNNLDTEVYFSRYMPVLPPKYRPIYPQEDGTLITSPLNHLYKDTIDINEQLKTLKDLPDSEKSDLRKDLYQAMRAVTGLGSPLTNPEYTGVVDIIKGRGQPKGGFFQSKLVSRRQELTGRSTITLDPHQHIDEAGIPEDMLYKVFEPFIIQELKNFGIGPLEAREVIKDRDPRASRALDSVLGKRTVFLNRAPSLHKHSVMAFKPKRASGRSIKLHPLVLKGFNADFDGDTMSVHVPISQEALTESKRMLPSQNLFNASGSLMSAPDQEGQVGLYLLTQNGKKTNKKYATSREALHAYQQGDLDETDLITVGNTTTSIGKMLVNSLLPERARKADIVMDKKTTKKLLTDIAKNNPMIAPSVLDKFKDLGNRAAYEKGFTVSLKDLEFDTDKVKKIYGKFDDKAEKIRGTEKDRQKRHNKLVQLFSKAGDEVEAELKKDLMSRRNAFADMVVSGAKGGWGQVKQMVASPGLVSTVTGAPFPYAVRHSYAEGLTPAEYWAAAHGARKGIVERAKQTAAPGELSKSLLHSTVDHLITMTDCRTKNGLEMATADAEAEDRYLAEPAGDLPRNSVLTAEARQKLLRKRIKTVKVRSPLTCEAPHGTCSKCFGLNEYGKPIPTGTNIGVISGQAITEPTTQMQMNTFHTGGLAGGVPQLDSFTKVRQLLEFPKVFKNAATLSTVSGTVDKIEPGKAGGHNITVSGTEHFIPPRFTVLVKKGQKVERGDALSDGIKNPREVLDLQGVMPAREFLSQELYDTYKSLGKDIRKKHFEVVTRSVTNSTQVLDAKKSDDFVPGDMAPYNVVIAKNRKYAKLVDVDKAKGKYPIEPVAGIGVPFAPLTDEDIEKLKKKGVSQLEVANSPIIHRPMLRGITMIPRERRDWVSQLAFRNLKETLKKGVQQGWESDLHGNNPIPGFVYGIDFGRDINLKK